MKTHTSQCWVLLKYLWWRGSRAYKQEKHTVAPDSSLVFDLFVPTGLDGLILEELDSDQMKRVQTYKGMI